MLDTTLEVLNTLDQLHVMSYLIYLLVDSVHRASPLYLYAKASSN